MEEDLDIHWVAPHAFRVGRPYHGEQHKAFMLGNQMGDIAYDEGIGRWHAVARSGDECLLVITTYTMSRAKAEVEGALRKWYGEQE